MRFLYVFTILSTVYLQFAENRQLVPRREYGYSNQYDFSPDTYSESRAVKSFNENKKPANKRLFGGIADTINTVKNRIVAGGQSIYRAVAGDPSAFHLDKFKSLIGKSKKDIAALFSISKLLKNTFSLMMYIGPYLIIYAIVIAIIYVLLPRGYQKLVQ